VFFTYFQPYLVEGKPVGSATTLFGAVFALIWCLVPSETSVRKPT
jgi:hypothetical protein